MQARSIFWWVFSRLLLFLGLASLLLVIHLSGVIKSISDENQRDALYVQTQLTRELIADDLQTAELPLQPSPDLNELCRDLGDLANARITLIAPDGRVVGDSRYGTRHENNLRNTREFINALAMDVGMATRDDPITSDPVQHQAVALRQGGAILGVLRLSRPVDRSPSSVSAVFHEAFIPILVLLALLAFVSFAVSRNVRGIAEEVAEFAKRFGGGRLALRPPRAHYYELDSMARSLDDMADSVEDEIRDLRRKRTQWEALFTGMREGLLAVDSEYNMITMNHAARDYLGLGADHPIQGRPLFMAVRNAKLNHFFHALFKSDSDYLEREFEIRHSADDVTIFRVSGVRFVPEPGAEPGALVVMHDITRVRRLETMRQEFVANVSHELKTPITSIKGFIETLEYMIKDDPEQAAHFLAIIAEQADRLNSIIDDLLALSRLEQSDQSLARDFEAQRIDETVNEAVHLCNSKIVDREITVNVDVPEITLYANHRLLTQAISNLVDNAVKYTPTGSTVNIRYDDSDGQAHLAISDNGPGIPPEHRERIFERFYRVDKSRDRQTGGTGLGLSIVKHIARIHGGSIIIDDASEGGCRFTLTLPRRTSASNG